jgi:hypothetical protein
MYRSAMRRFRTLLIVLIVLGIVGVGADFVAGRLFESRTRTAVQQHFDLAKKPAVEVRDFPFLFSLARGKLRTVDVAVSDVRTEGLTIEDLQLTLHDVTIPREVVTGGSGTVTVEGAGGRLRLSEEEINRLLAERLKGAKVQLDERGMQIEARQVILGQTVDALVRGRLEARGGKLVFTPQQVDAGGVSLPAQILDQIRGQAFEYPLPPLPGGLVPEGIVTEPGALVVTGRLGALDIAV